MGRRKKKVLDNLELDMIQCEKDGFGVHYGRWKATQEAVVPVKKDEIPKGWRKCERCGKPFKPNRHNQKYCEWNCRYLTFLESKKNNEYVRKYRERKAAEKNL